MGVVVWDQCVEVLIPQMDDHVFKGGTWRMERRLRQGVSYQLRGVKTGNKPPEGLFGVNATVHSFPIVDRSPSRVFCSIYLPFPKRVVSGRLAEGTENLKFNGLHGAQVTTRQFAMVNVLCYDVSDPKDLALVPDLIWEKKVKRNRTVNLHLFAEEDSILLVDLDPVGPDHVEKAFVNLVALFPGLDLQVRGSGSLQGSGFIRDVPGLPDFEQKTLYERWSFKREEDPDLPDEPEPGRPANCMALVVNNLSR
jgi:hypothetical protein